MEYYPFNFKLPTFILCKSYFKEITSNWICIIKLYLLLAFAKFWVYELFDQNCIQRVEGSGQSDEDKHKYWFYLSPTGADSETQRLGGSVSLKLWIWDSTSRSCSIGQGEKVMLSRVKTPRPPSARGRRPSLEGRMAGEGSSGARASSTGRRRACWRWGPL